jgi:hypothetical protein
VEAERGEEQPRVHARALRLVDELWHEVEVWPETPFAPAHAVATPAGFELPGLDGGEVYTLVCATFEPGKTGPFVLLRQRGSARLFSEYHAAAAIFVLCRGGCGSRRVNLFGVYHAEESSAEACAASPSFRLGY